MLLQPEVEAILVDDDDLGGEPLLPADPTHFTPNSVAEFPDVESVPRGLPRLTASGTGDLWQFRLFSRIA